MTPNDYYIAWWNLENLFDSWNTRARSNKLKRVLRSELEGWTLEMVKKKVTQLARVIRHMNGFKGPDVLGVCEEENLSVLKRLVKAVFCWLLIRLSNRRRRTTQLAYVANMRTFSTRPTVVRNLRKRSSCWESERTLRM